MTEKNIPKDGSSNKDAYNTIAPDYANYEWERTDLEELTKKINNLSGCLPLESEVLVIGCSAGRESKLLMDLGHKVCSIDYSSALINEAKKRVDGDFRTIDLLELEKEFTPESFTSIYCGSALQHIDPKYFNRALELMHGVLTEGGYAIIGLKEGAEAELFETHDFEVERTYFLHSEQAVRTAAEEHNFSVIDVWTSIPWEQDKPIWMNFLLKK